MSGAHTAALATLRRVVEALRAGVDPEDRFHVAKLAREAVELLELGADRRRMSSKAIADRVQRLEQQLADRKPSEREAIIRERLGIGRSTYYRARKVCNVPLRRDGRRV